MKRFYQAFVLLLVIITAISVAGCAGSGGSGNNEDYSAISDNTVMGRSIYVHDSNIAFFGYDNLLCSAKFQEGSLSEFVIEGGLTGNIYTLAVYGNDLYVSASDGLFKYDLDMFTSGQSSAKPVVLWKERLSEFNHFQIFDDKIFFVYGTSLCYIPTEGGEKVDLTTETGDFEVTTNGIYYTKKDGSLHLMSLDFKDDTAVADLSPAAVIQQGGGKLYYIDGDELKAYSIGSDKVEEIDLEEDINEYEDCIWTNGTNILYLDEAGNARLHTSDGEKDLGSDVRFPGKSFGFRFGDYMLRAMSRTIRIYSLTDGTVRDYDLSSEMAAALSQVADKMSGSSGITGSSDSTGGSSGQNGTGSSSGQYDILAGSQIKKEDNIVYLYGNDFLLTMPLGYEDWDFEQNTPDSFSVVYIPGKNAGCGGNLVTIKAYDPGDTSYENIPSYHIAGRGQNTDKVFVAIYPTDVQWDMNNASQEARYKDLLEYLEKIGEGAVNSPFQTADSD